MAAARVIKVSGCAARVIKVSECAAVVICAAAAVRVVRVQPVLSSYVRTRGGTSEIFVVGEPPLTSQTIRHTCAAVIRRASTGGYNNRIGC